MQDIVGSIATIIAQEQQIPLPSVTKTLALIQEGATIPFLARYRKEVTGGLDEVQLGAIKERTEYLVELHARRETILNSLIEQGKLTDELKTRILITRSKTELEDLYLPYKPKRRTKATIAKERGLEPLADLIWQQPDSLSATRAELAAPYINAEKDVLDAEAAFQGARDILAERVSEDADIRAALRDQALNEGRMTSKRSTAKRAEKTDGPAELNQSASDPQNATKYQDYFEFSELAKTLPSHRILALRRGEKEGFLRVALEVDRDLAVSIIRSRVVKNPKTPLLSDLDQAVCDAYDRLLITSIEADVRLTLKDRADQEAISVFALNLRHLLLAAPLGQRPVIGIDPGFRTGCKVVALDATGTLLTETVIYPHEPQKKLDEAKKVIAGLAEKIGAEAVAIGNGTAGRETENMVREMVKEKLLPAGCMIISVNESGASVYSASEIAREEFPDQDVTVRGAVSIGRRLQDPLAELVKIDPKSIGVGQYQHDVNQNALKKSLDTVVESCVNAVGVEVNTASAKLLSYVSGIGETVAKNIVLHRMKHGPFKSRQDFLNVARLGPKVFEQAAGFLRIRGAQNPLDASAVHPESYDLVERMAKDLNVSVAEITGQAGLAARINYKSYVDDRRGEPTILDILSELEKPGRDPREKFEEVGFREDITEFSHLNEGMILNGVITNVTKFGAFVDVGVHQDGLVHVSELSHRFVTDPAEVVKVGDRVSVKVINLDRERRRIGLSIKQTTAPPAGSSGRPGAGAGQKSNSSAPPQRQNKAGGGFANTPRIAPAGPKAAFNPIRIRQRDA